MIDNSRKNYLNAKAEYFAASYKYSSKLIKESLDTELSVFINALTDEEYEYCTTLQEMSVGSVLGGVAAGLRAGSKVVGDVLQNLFGGVLLDYWKTLFGGTGVGSGHGMGTKAVSDILGGADSPVGKSLRDFLKLYGDSDQLGAQVKTFTSILHKDNDTFLDAYSKLIGTYVAGTASIVKTTNQIKPHGIDTHHYIISHGMSAMSPDVMRKHMDDEVASFDFAGAVKSLIPVRAGVDTTGYNDAVTTYATSIKSHVAAQVPLIIKHATATLHSDVVANYTKAAANTTVPQFQGKQISGTRNEYNTIDPLMMCSIFRANTDAFFNKGTLVLIPVIVANVLKKITADKLLPEGDPADINLIIIGSSTPETTSTSGGVGKNLRELAANKTDQKTHVTTDNEFSKASSEYKQARQTMVTSFDSALAPILKLCAVSSSDIDRDGWNALGSRGSSAAPAPASTNANTTAAPASATTPPNNTPVTIDTILSVLSSLSQQPKPDPISVAIMSHVKAYKPVDTMTECVAKIVGYDENTRDSVITDINSTYLSEYNHLFALITSNKDVADAVRLLSHNDIPQKTPAPRLAASVDIMIKTSTTTTTTTEAASEIYTDIINDDPSLPTNMGDRVVLYIIRSMLVGFESGEVSKATLVESIKPKTQFKKFYYQK